MWTPTDHWLEITIETLGRWEGWLAQGALQGEKYLRESVLHTYAALFFFFFSFFHKIFVNIAYKFHDEAFREEERVVISQKRLLIRIGETCQINLNGAEL